LEVKKKISGLTAGLTNRHQVLDHYSGTPLKEAQNFSSLQTKNTSIIFAMLTKKAGEPSRKGNISVLMVEMLNYGLTGARESRPYMSAVRHFLNRHDYWSA
jgi:hypothetical protein